MANDKLISDDKKRRKTIPTFFLASTPQFSAAPRVLDIGAIRRLFLFFWNNTPSALQPHMPTTPSKLKAKKCQKAQVALNGAVDVVANSSILDVHDAGA